jgi:hypothetical protein
MQNKSRPVSGAAFANAFLTVGLKCPDLFGFFARGLDQKEEHNADEDKVDHGVDKIADQDIPDHDVRKVGIAGDHPQNGRNNIVDQRVNDFLKGAANDHGNRQGKHIAAHQKGLEFL